MKFGTKVEKDGREMMVTTHTGNLVGCIWRTERGISADRFMADTLTVVGEYEHDYAHEFRMAYEMG